MIMVTYFELFVIFTCHVHGSFGNKFTLNEIPRGRRQADLVFMLDRSGSVGAANFETEKSFVRNILLHFSVDPSNARVAVLTYSDSAELHVDYFRQSRTKCEFTQDITDVVYENGGRTNTGDGLRLAMDIFSHARPASMKVIFLLSDGFANHGPDPVPLAEQLRSRNITIFAFGVGRASRQGLSEITGSDRNVFFYSSFKEFGKLARSIRGDPHETNWVDPFSPDNCDHMCDLSALPQEHLAYGYGCCSVRAKCMCGLKEGVHSCMCPPGEFGLDGTYGNCKVCPHGHFKAGYSAVDKCQPCPIHSTTNLLGATSLKDCRCKNGYVGNPAKGDNCKIVTCPPLRAPAHGYVSPKNCRNTFRSTCKFGCEYQYHLRETLSRKRICRSNGEWSGPAAVCKVVTCPPLPRVIGAATNCTTATQAAGTVCVYTCQSGWIMRHGPSLRCGMSGRWKGIVPTCEALTCQALPPLKNGYITDKCIKSRQLPGGACVFDCNDGFQIEGPSVIICNHKGKWTDDQSHLYYLRSTRCVDIQPPTLRCPLEVDAEADPGRNTTLVKWNIPYVIDNGSLKPKVKVVPSLCSKLPVKLAIGSHRITYSATDGSSNIASCSFTVTVVDVEKPVVLSCPDSIEVTSVDETEVNWEEPQFEDNSGQPLDISQSHGSGQIFPLGGPWQVTYEARDMSGNIGICKFEVIIKKEQCPYHPPPVNGAIACDDWMFGQFCRIYCNEKFEFAFHPASLYICSAAKWNTMPPMKQIPWPDCSEKGNPVARLAVLSQYYSGNCHDESTQLQIKTLFIEFLKNYTRKAIPDFCSGPKACHVDYVNVYCGEQSNESAPRVRREITDNEIIIEFTLAITSNDSEETWPESQQVIEGLLRDLKFGNLSIPTTDLRVMESSVVCEPGSLLRDTFCVRCPVGTFYNVTSVSCDMCPPGEYQDEEGQLQCKPCVSGTWTFGGEQKNYTECKEICGPGTFSKTGLETCISCPLGMYQSEMMKKYCLPCPADSTTAVVGAKSELQCRELCPPGQSSDTGLQPCDACPVGTYQDMNGSPTCHPCSDGQTTRNSGSTNILDCQDIDFCVESPCFHDGTCITKQDGFLCTCGEGYTGLACDTDIDECLSLPCYNGGTCVNEGGSFYCVCDSAFTGDDCFTEIDECDNVHCQNNGICMDRLGFFECFCQSGWSGQYCEIAISPCDLIPCLNNGSCSADENKQPVCTCPPGFTGVECEVDIDECLSSPCVRGKCVDRPGTYFCECPSDATEVDCSVKLDNCDGVTCENGGTCNDLEGGFTCICRLPWEGQLCQTKIATNSTLRFNKPHPWNYVKVKGIPDLSALSVSLSCRNTTPDVYGTILSYAFSGNEESVIDNALTVSDMGDLRIHVMNEEISTELDVGDGNWNHLVITWSSNGSLNIYVNGSRVFSASDVGRDKTIRGGGALILGQDQDSVGGSFSASEAFIGEITGFNIWSRVLTPQEIRDSHSTCNSEQFGDVVAFPHIITGNTDHVTMITEQTCG